MNLTKLIYCAQTSVQYIGLQGPHYRVTHFETIKHNNNNL